MNAYNCGLDVNSTNITKSNGLQCTSIKRDVVLNLQLQWDPMLMTSCQTQSWTHHWCELQWAPKDDSRHGQHNLGIIYYLQLQWTPKGSNVTLPSIMHLLTPILSSSNLWFLLSFYTRIQSTNVMTTRKKKKKKDEGKLCHMDQLYSDSSSFWNGGRVSFGSGLLRKKIFLIMQLYNPLYVLSVHHCVSAEYNGNTSTRHVYLRQGDTLWLAFMVQMMKQRI